MHNDPRPIELLKGDQLILSKILNVKQLLNVNDEEHDSQSLTGTHLRSPQKDQDVY